MTPSAPPSLAELRQRLRRTVDAYRQMVLSPPIQLWDKELALLLDALDQRDAALRASADRWADLAEVIDERGSYDNAGFCRASAERARALLGAEPTRQLPTAAEVRGILADDASFAPPAPVPDDLIADLTRALGPNNTDCTGFNRTLIERARDRIAAQAQRIEGAMASRNYAIDLLASALGIEADKVRAVEYYSRLASERIAELEREVAELRKAQVPREPTQAMIARAFESRPDLPLSQWLNNGIMRGLWTAMYDAARTVPQAGGGARHE